MTVSPENTFCPNCNTQLIGTFCHACGQKVLEPKERTFRHFVFQFFGSAFFLENNFMKNLWVLLTKPGRLSSDFMEGKRKRWMPPFSLFLLINIFYFWYTPFSDFNLTLKEHMNVSPYAAFATSLINERLEKRNSTLENYVTTFERKSGSYANSLVVLHVPFLALLLSLLYYRNRLFFADHFVFALHLLGFVLLISLIIALLLFIDGYVFSFITMHTQLILKWLYALAIVAYTWLSLHRMYQRKWWATSLMLPVVLTAFLFIHFLWRFLLFLILFSLT